MSSSSSYSSSSPPSSPQATPTSTDFPNHRLFNSVVSASTNGETTILKTLKIKPRQIDDVVSWPLDETKKTNGDSSNKESLEFSQEVITNGVGGIRGSGKIIDMVESLLAANNNNNGSHVKNNGGDDIEATYMTSVSKNLITLRKTESLKLDSVQSIR